MNPDDVAKILDELGKRLGPAGSHVFELAVRQQVIQGIITLATQGIVIALGLVAVAVGIWLHKKEIKAGTNWPTDPTIGFFVSFVGGLVVGLALFMLLITLPTTITQLINPEYAAIKEILYAIR